MSVVRTGASSKWARRSALLVTSMAMVASLAACAGDDDSAADDTTDAVAEADAAVAEAEQQLEAAQEEVASLEAERDELVAEVDAATEASADEIARLEDEVAVVQLQADANLERAETAEALVAEIETVMGQFPIQLDSSLIPEDMPGSYSITFEEAYCDGFSNCGTVPQPTTAEIYYTDQQFLRIGVNGILDAGLFAMSGSLYGITDTQTLLPPCGDTAQPARITISLYADDIEVLEDGTRVVKNVNADITLDARPQPGCDAGLRFFAAQLTPNG